MKFAKILRFELNKVTKGNERWPAAVIAFRCITPLYTREAHDEVLAWCGAQFGPRGGTWGWSDPWMTFSDRDQAVAFRLRWT